MMDFRLPDHVRALQSEVRVFLDRAWPPAKRTYAINDSVVRDLEGDDVLAFRHALGKTGYLGIGLPEKYGGRPGGVLERFILQSELAAAGAPFNATAVGIVAPMLVRYAAAALRKELLPGIIRGQLDFALGYTESQAGSDLASLATKARRSGDQYVVTGEKVYSTAAHLADYYWLAARTDDSGKKQQGISLFIVPLDSPGITISPLYTMSGIRTNIVRLDEVVVPLDYRIGDEGAGWHIMMEALNGERFAVMFVAPVLRAFEEILQFCRTTLRRGEPLIGDLSIQQQLIGFDSAIRGAFLASLRIAWMADRGNLPAAEASALKVEVTELRYRIATFASDVLGSRAPLTPEDPGAPSLGELERMYRHAVITLFTGGANAVQRDLIARHGLGLGRSQ